MKKSGAILIFTIIALISCFVPMAEDVVYAVEDSKNPVIVISSPEEDSIYMSIVTIEGHVVDDSQESGDNKGSLKSLSVSASGDPSHKGRIEIDSDGSYKLDADFGGISRDNFIYNPGNRSFTIKIGTTELSSSRTMNITLKAVDRNDNETRKTLQLQPSVGPYIDLTSPVDNFPPEGPIEIRGTVANSGTQRDKYDELKSIRLQIPRLNINVELEIEGAEVTNDLIVKTIPGRDNYELQYNINTLELLATVLLQTTEKEEIINGKITSLGVIVSATDKNDNTTKVEEDPKPSNKKPEITAGLSPTRKYYYSASASSEVRARPFYGLATSTKSPERLESLTFTGKVYRKDGNEITTQLEFVNRKDSNPRVVLAPTTSSDKVVGFSYTTNFVSDFIHNDGSGAGDTTVILSATDDASSVRNRTTEMRWLIEEDSAPPEFIFSNSSTDPSFFVNGNTGTLEFTVRDVGTGVDFDTLTVTNSDGSNDNIGNIAKTPSSGVCSVDIRQLGNNTQRTIRISVKDKIGNTRTITTPRLETISIASSITSSTAIALRTSTIILTVRASQDLKPSNFTATIAGRNTTVPQVSNSRTLTATLSGNQIPSTYDNGDLIPFVITGFKDKAGIPGVLNSITSTTNGTSVKYYSERPELTFREVSVTDGYKDEINNKVYLKSGSTFTLIVNSSQRLTTNSDRGYSPPTVTFSDPRDSSTIPSTTTTTVASGLVTVTGTLSGTDDSDIRVTISGIKNADGLAAGPFSQSLGKYYHDKPELIFNALRATNGNKDEANDMVYLRGDGTFVLTVRSTQRLTIKSDSGYSPPTVSVAGPTGTPSIDFASDGLSFTVTSGALSGAAVSDIRVTIRGITNVVGEVADPFSRTLGKYYHSGPVLTLRANTLSATNNGKVNNNMVYLRENGAFALTVDSTQPLANIPSTVSVVGPTCTPTIDFASNRLSFTVTSGALSGRVDSDIRVTISGLENAAGAAGTFSRTLGKYYHSGPTLFFREVSALTNGEVDNNMVYLREDGSFELTVTSSQRLTIRGDSDYTPPTVTIRPSITPSPTISFPDRSSFTVTGTLSGRVDSDISVTISGIKNAAGEDADDFSRSLGKYYPSIPTITDPSDSTQSPSVTLVDNGDNTLGDGDIIVLNFSTSDRVPHDGNQPVVTLTLDSTKFTPTRDTTSTAAPTAPTYRYTYTIEAGDVSGTTASVGYNISFTDMAGNTGTATPPPTTIP